MEDRGFVDFVVMRRGQHTLAQTADLDQYVKGVFAAINRSARLLRYGFIFLDNWVENLMWFDAEAEEMDFADYEIVELDDVYRYQGRRRVFFRK